jgi:hypothetical protein
MAIGDKFWFDYPQILIHEDRLSEFYISKDMTTTEKLNAIVRFFIYTSILSTLYTNNTRFLLLPFLALAITYFIHSNSSEKYDQTEEMASSEINEFDEIDVKVPTIDNPFMNPSLFDNPSTFKATDYSDNSPESNAIKQEIYKKFSHNLFKDSNDIFDTNNSFRQFYTVPNNINTFDDTKDFLFGSFATGGRESGYNQFKNLYDNLKNKRNTNIQ